MYGDEYIIQLVKELRSYGLHNFQGTLPPKFSWNGNSSKRIKRYLLSSNSEQLILTTLPNPSNLLRRQLCLELFLSDLKLPVAPIVRCDPSAGWSISKFINGITVSNYITKKGDSPKDKLEILHQVAKIYKEISFAICSNNIIFNDCPNAGHFLKTRLINLYHSLTVHSEKSYLSSLDRMHLLIRQAIKQCLKESSYLLFISESQSFFTEGDAGAGNLLFCDYNLIVFDFEFASRGFPFADFIDLVVSIDLYIDPQQVWEIFINTWDLTKIPSQKLYNYFSISIIIEGLEWYLQASGCAESDRLAALKYLYWLAEKLINLIDSESIRNILGYFIQLINMSLEKK